MNHDRRAAAERPCSIAAPFTARLQFQFNLRTIFWLTAFVAVGLWLKRVIPIPNLERKAWYGIVVVVLILTYCIRRVVLALLKIRDMEL
jgi:hypothetical protein